MDGFVEYVGGDKGPVDRKKLADLVQKLKAANAWVVPTADTWDATYGAIPLSRLQSYDELRYLPKSAPEVWAKAYEQNRKSIDVTTSKNVVASRLTIFEALRKAGIRMLLGTDSPQVFSVPGFSLHREMAWMQKAGVSPYDVLRMATVNAGQYFKQDSFGTIEAGRRADLLLVDADPLKDVSNTTKINGVMVRGKWYSRADLDAGLLALQQKALADGLVQDVN
jgi:imidazolonepropionase-like amidohydrolase